MDNQIKFLRRVLLNQIYMLRHFNKVEQREDTPIEKSENMICEIDGQSRSSTPLSIKFIQQLPGVRSSGIINSKLSLSVNFNADRWQVLTISEDGLTGCKLIAIDPDVISQGDIIYSSNDPHDDFTNLSSYYLCIGNKFVAWGCKGGINVWDTTGNYIWKVEI